MEQTISRVPMQQVEPLGASMSLPRHDVVGGVESQDTQIRKDFLQLQSHYINKLSACRSLHCLIVCIITATSSSPLYTLHPTLFKPFALPFTLNSLPPSSSV